MADTTMGSGAFHLDFSFANYVEFLRDHCALDFEFSWRDQKCSRSTFDTLLRRLLKSIGSICESGARRRAASGPLDADAIHAHFPDNSYTVAV